MSKLAITTVSIALLTAAGFAHANGHEDPQVVIEKLQQEKSVLLKRLNNAIAYSKNRGEQIETLQAKADAEQERRTALSSRLNNSNAFAKTRMDHADNLQTQLEAEQGKSQVLSKRLRKTIAVSKSRGAQLNDVQAIADSVQSKNQILAKRLRNAIAVSKSRGVQLAGAQNKNILLNDGLSNAMAVSRGRRAKLAEAQYKSKVLSDGLSNALDTSKKRRAQLAEAQHQNKVLKEGLSNALNTSRSRRAQLAELSSKLKEQDDWPSQTSASLNANFGGIQGTTVRANSDGSVTIQVGNNGLFNTGSTIISANGSQLLSTIAQGLSGVNGYFTVIGHTDDVPVGNSSRFRSNKELSFARAVSTLEALSDQGIRTARLSAAGYGDDLPIASNDTSEGRQQNRRVEIVLRK